EILVGGEVGGEIAGAEGVGEVQHDAEGFGLAAELAAAEEAAEEIVESVAGGLVETGGRAVLILFEPDAGQFGTLVPGALGEVVESRGNVPGADPDVPLQVELGGG